MVLEPGLTTPGEVSFKYLEVIHPALSSQSTFDSLGVDSQRQIRYARITLNSLVSSKLCSLLIPPIFSVFLKSRVPPTINYVQLVVEALNGVHV